MTALTRAAFAVGALLVLATGCATAEPSTSERYIGDVRQAVGSSWTDGELWTLSSIACSAPGSVYDKSVTLKAQRAALDQSQAQAVATAATTYICPS